MTNPATPFGEFNYNSNHGAKLEFHSWGDVTSENINEMLVENQNLKPLRVALFKTMIDFLKQLQIPYWISDGTALACYRDNGVMIPHDYDTDLTIMECHLPAVYRNLHLLPSVVGVRTKCDYSGKEWIDSDGNGIKFDPTIKSSKKFVFYDRRDWSHLRLCDSHSNVVETDLYTWREIEGNPGSLANNYAAAKDGMERKRWSQEVIFPLKNYMFEGIEVLGPNDMKTYLEVLYGYLGRDAVWDATVQYYVKRNSNGVINGFSY